MKSPVLVVTSIVIPPHIRELLRELAEERAQKLGGRPSVSQTITALVLAEVAKERSARA